MQVKGRAVWVSNRKADQVQAAGKGVIEVKTGSVRADRWINKQKEQAEMKSKDKPGVGTVSVQAEPEADQVATGSQHRNRWWVFRKCNRPNGKDWRS